MEQKAASRPLHRQIPINRFQAKSRVAAAILVSLLDIGELEELRPAGHDTRSAGFGPPQRSAPLVRRAIAQLHQGLRNSADLLRSSWSG